MKTTQHTIDRSVVTPDTIAKLINMGRKQVAKTADPYASVKDAKAKISKDAALIYRWFRQQADATASRRAFKKIVKIQFGPRRGRAH